MPPDVTYILGFVSLLRSYYAAAKLDAIWQKHQPEYLALIDQYHGPVAGMITSTDNYLRMPLSGYAGRSFTVYLEPMAAPGQVNSRNYLQDYYYLVISPAGSNIHMEALRHTYLHFAAGSADRQARYGAGPFEANPDCGAKGSDGGRV